MLSPRVQAGKRAKHLLRTIYIGQSSWSRFLSQLYDHYLELFFLFPFFAWSLLPRVCFLISFSWEFYLFSLLGFIIFLYDVAFEMRPRGREAPKKRIESMVSFFCMLVLRANLTKSHDCLSSFCFLFSSLGLLFLPQSGFFFFFFFHISFYPFRPKLGTESERDHEHQGADHGKQKDSHHQGRRDSKWETVLECWSGFAHRKVVNQANFCYFRYFS